MTTKNMISLEIDAKNDPYTKSTHYMFDDETTRTDMLRQAIDILVDFRYHHVLAPIGRRSNGTNILIVPKENIEMNQIMTQVIAYLDKSIERIEVREASK